MSDWTRVHMKCFFSLIPTVVDLAPAHEEAGRPWAPVLHFPRVQDERETGDVVHHRPLHQLRHRHEPGLGRTSRALDPTRRRSALPAELVMRQSLKGGIFKPRIHTVQPCYIISMPFSVMNRSIKLTQFWLVVFSEVSAPFQLSVSSGYFL